MVREELRNHSFWSFNILFGLEGERQVDDNKLEKVWEFIRVVPALGLII